jgi:ribosomal protein L29
MDIDELAREIERLRRELSDLRYEVDKLRYDKADKEHYHRQYASKEY